MNQHVSRLQVLLSTHEETDETKAAERCNQAALDSSPALERHRKYKATLREDLKRTLATFRRMQKMKFGTGSGETAED
jgi:hypothetical protein